MIWYKCKEGHFSLCAIGNLQREFFCKKCNIIYPKKQSEKYADKRGGRSINAEKDIVRHLGRMLYPVTPSARINYHKKNTK